MYQYQGNELKIFSKAHNWKRYFSSRMRSLICGDVLDVGAGWGVNANYLVNDNCLSWTFLEPDYVNFSLIRKQSMATKNCKRLYVNGKIDDLESKNRYDTIIYIDVLEHIENDKKEISSAHSFLKEKGKIIVLVPCHNYLFSEFDRNVGHFRRYSVRDLYRLESTTLKLRSYYYLDSMGFFCSLINRYILKKPTPSVSNITFWDRFLIPLSCIFDKFLNHSFGKTLVAIYEPINHTKS